LKLIIDITELVTASPCAK